MHNGYLYFISRNYKFHNPEGLYFVSFVVVYWLDVFTRNSYKEFLLEKFKEATQKTSNVKNYQFWRHDNKPIELWSNKVIKQKINYIHNNPVAAGLVFKPYDYVYSSAIDYCDEPGLLKNIIVFRSFD